MGGGTLDAAGFAYRDENQGQALGCGPRPARKTPTNKTGEERLVLESRQHSAEFCGSFAKDRQLDDPNGTGCYLSGYGVNRDLGVCYLPTTSKSLTYSWSDSIETPLSLTISMNE
jgi:hypothetical protein